MGKKNFVEDYDPLRSQLSRDLEKVAPPPTQRQPVRAEPPRPEPRSEPRQPIVELPTERPAAGGGGRTERAVRRVQAPAADAAGVEVSPRIKVSQAAFQDLEALLTNLHRATGSQIHYSIATRALWGLLVQAEAQIQDELGRAQLGRLPSTREKLAYAEYEERVKQAFAAAFRKLPRSLFHQAIAQEREANEG